MAHNGVKKCYGKERCEQMKKLILLLVVVTIVLMMAGCGGGGSKVGGDNLPSFTYTPIPGVPQTVNDLGKRICQEQRNVVTPGGDEWGPGFSSYDQSVFDGSGKLAKIVSDVTGSSTFKNGVAAIRALPAETQSLVFGSFGTPLYPTWGMNGHIGSDGTTDAGYAVEGEIATALTNAVKAAL